MARLQLQPTVTIAPAPAAWSAALGARATPLDSLAARTRVELGLPTDGPVVLSGHQAAFWHAGIVAKWLALGLLEARGAAIGWVVVDQDPEDLSVLRYPAAEGGGWKSQRWAVAPEAISRALAADCAPARLGAFEPTAVPETAGDLASVGEGLAAMRAALLARRGAASAAEQVARATADLLKPLGPTPRLVWATAVARTAGFGWLLEQMRRDPMGCVKAYNAAVGRRPGARVVLLRADAERGRAEMPLWTINPSSGARGRIWSDELATADITRLAPRGLAMTAFLRLFACDLFIHGLGGAGSDGRGGYDAVTADWIGAWLAKPLALTATVTGTLLLPLSDHAPVTDAQLSRARWSAHHARHSPKLLAEPGAEAAKQALVALLAKRRRPRAERSELFSHLHVLLGDVRAAHGPQLVALAAHADALEARRHEDAVAADRTWPFPLHSSAALTALRERLAFVMRIGAGA